MPVVDGSVSLASDPADGNVIRSLVSKGLNIPGLGLGLNLLGLGFSLLRLGLVKFEPTRCGFRVKTGLTGVEVGLIRVRVGPSKVADLTMRQVKIMDNRYMPVS